ncbi:hypothetical protein LKO27_03600 [Tessaracoccus sp. OS52]|uniref:hypothetical protein n=1 Tax=Tessaracoccus sp. OS52 TaxID=2886691 RepID=UPI001D118D8A|nr:hypothetical protein [Tessaracoccus sp. OS52]MCC2592506.1 hypothetical protein [Tessaracoccus sp. OS52]
MRKMTQTTYGVRGLSCQRCLVSALDAVRALPGVRAVAMDLVPSGESLLTVAPADAVTGDQVRASLGTAGFELTRRRREQHRGWETFVPYRQRRT